MTEPRKPLGKLLLEEDIASEKKVTMTRPDGTVVTLPMSQRDEAFGQGYQMATGEDVAGSSQRRFDREMAYDPLLQAGAFSAGALRTTTMGLSDLAIAQAATGDYSEGAEGLAGLRETAPAASMAGEIAGVLNPYSPAGKVGALSRVGSSLLARTGASALAGGVEGAMYGAGKAVSDTVLEGAPITYERVTQEIGTGALWGSVAGAALPAAGAVVKSGVRRLSPTAQGLERTARQEAVRAIGGATAKSSDEVGELLLSYELKSGPRAGKPLMQAFKGSDDIAADVRQMRQELGDELAALQGQVDEQMGPVYTRWAQRVNDELVEPAIRADPAKGMALRKRLDSINEQIAIDTAGTGRRAGEATPFLKTQLAGEVPGQLEGYVIPLGEGAVSRPPRWAGPPTATSQVNRLRELVPPGEMERILGETIKEGEEAALRNLGRAPDDLARLQRNIATADRAVKLVDDAAAADVEQLSGGASPFGKGGSRIDLWGVLGAVLSGHIGPIVRFGGRAAWNLLRDNMDAPMALLAKQMASKGERIEEAARKLAGVREPIRRTAAFAATYERPKPAAEKPRPRPRPSKKEVLEEADEAMDTVEAVRGMGLAYRIQVLSQSPVVMALAARDPRMARGIIDQALKTQDILETRLPHRYASANMLQPTFRKMRRTRADKMRFASFYRGVNDPTIVMEDLAEGNLDREAMAGFRAAYPAEYERVRRTVLEQVFESESGISVKRRRLLGMAFEIPADPSIDPQSIGGAQTEWDRLEEEQKNEAPPEQNEQKSAMVERMELDYGNVAPRR